MMKIIDLRDDILWWHIDVFRTIEIMYINYVLDSNIKTDRISKNKKEDIIMM